MPVRAPILLAASQLVLLVAVALLGVAGGTASAATSSTVVGAAVPSSISLGDSCHQQAAWSFGTLLPGSGVTTATGAGVCRFTWSSSNDSSMLRIHQADRTGAAMQGQASTWSTVTPSGARVDWSGAGTLMLGMTTWAAAPMHRSTDSGASFGVLAEPGDYSAVSVVSSTMAWRTGPSGIQRSLDANVATPTWTTVPTALPDGCTSIQAVSAVDPSTTWVLCGNDAYLTTNAGTSWVQSPGDIATNPEYIEAAGAATAFANGWGTIRRTTNSNASWADAMTGIPGGRWITWVSSSPGTPSTVWAVDTAGTVYRSTDTGSNWAATSAMPGPLDAYVIEAASASTAIVAGEDGLAYITTNSGVTWTRLRAPTTGAIREIVALDATRILLAVTHGSTFATTNGGADWVESVAARDDAVDTDAVDKQVIVTADAYGRVRLTTNGGSSWSTRQTPIHPYAVRGVALHGSGLVDSTQRIIAVGDLGRIAVSFDGGSSWQRPESGTTQDLWDVDVRSDGTALAVGDAGTILRSTDWGTTWTSVGAATALLRGVHVHPDGTAVAVGHGGLIRRSTDHGATWSTRASGTTVDLVDLSMPSAEVVYASGIDTLRKSVDGGASWTAITTMAAASVTGTSRVAAATDDTVWLFQAHVGGWDASWAARSTDGGATWTRPFAGNWPMVSSPLALDSGTVLIPGEGGMVRVTNPAPTIADYSAGSWAGGTARFGVCLQAIGGAAAPASFPVDGDGTCQLLDSDPWQAVPIAPAKIGQVAAPGSGSVDLVWGLRAHATTAPGEYSAGIVVTALAPNA